jgi:anaerobilin synthase
VKLNTGPTLMKFDRQLPIYNWLYPLKGQDTDRLSLHAAHEKLEVSEIKTRAFYIHIPFCETICTFCSLNRGLGSEGDDAIERYVQALIKEFYIKAKIPAVTAVPPRVIWFGGGTPSILTPDQIRRVGRALHDCFDLSQVEEWTIEFEVKSLSREKCEAFREIGVNKSRFGLQTFNPKYRKLFNITATLDQTYAAPELLGEYFDWRSFDILYGMHGQTVTEFAEDIQKAVDLGTETCEFYPVNHLVTTNMLHTGYSNARLEPLTYVDRMGLTVFLNHYMRSSGFKLYNGHGYVRLPDPEAETDFVSSRYSNAYHEYCWAHWDDDLIGFGSSAVTQTGAWTIMNDETRTGFVKSIEADETIKVKVTEADGVPYERGLVLGLPYHGSIKKERVPFDRISPEVLGKLDELIAENMIIERDDEYAITETGWTWYVNMMYYLSPASDQKILDDFVSQRSKNAALNDGKRSTIPVREGGPRAKRPLIPIQPLRNAKSAQSGGCGSACSTAGSEPLVAVAG